MFLSSYVFFMKFSSLSSVYLLPILLLASWFNDCPILVLVYNFFFHKMTQIYKTNSKLMLANFRLNHFPAYFDCPRFWFTHTYFHPIYFFLFNRLCNPKCYWKVRGPKFRSWNCLPLTFSRLKLVRSLWILKFQTSNSYYLKRSMKNWYSSKSLEFFQRFHYHG